jgi:ABC-2 type transport system permease protein
MNVPARSMSDHAAAAPATREQSLPIRPVSDAPTAATFWPTISALWQREVRGFYRQRSRVIAGLVTPLIFWLALGSGFGASLRTPVGGYMEFFFPGAVALVVLFASIFANISIIEDRREGFLLSVLVAPTPRLALVLGKVMGASTIGAMQGALFLPLIPLLGIPVSPAGLPAAGAAVALMAFGLTSIGFFFAWRLNSIQGFHSVMNVVLMPMWLLSGGLFPFEGAHWAMAWLMRLNPLFYGVTALRRALTPEIAIAGPGTTVCWTVMALFAAASLALAVAEANRRSPEGLA